MQHTIFSDALCSSLCACCLFIKPGKHVTQVSTIQNGKNSRFYKKINKVAINSRIHVLLYLRIKMLK